MWWKKISQDFFNENIENFFQRKQNISEEYSLKFIYLILKKKYQETKKKRKKSSGTNPSKERKKERPLDF